MAGFSTSRRKAVIEGYLAKTGRNMFVPSEFVDWLALHPDHEFYDAFFGMSDEDAARAHRIELARGLVRGLRIVVAEPEVTGSAPRVNQFPMMISPLSWRESGGGYVIFDPTNSEAMAELREQGRRALQSWLDRYSGAFADSDLSALQALTDPEN